MGRKALWKAAVIVAVITILLGCMPMSAPAAVAAGKTIYVSTSGSDATGNGTQANPYKTITKGLYLALVGDTVQVAAGSYTESISLVNEVRLQGAGAESTTIDGGGADSVVTAESQAVEPSTVVDGFTITNASRGIWCKPDSHPSITNCTISGNSSFGIVCQSSSPTITNCTISGNNYGIYCDYSSPTITNCTIVNNGSDGMYCDYSSPTITNCTISGNGIIGIYCWHSSPTISNCTVSGNGSYGISCHNSSSLTISNCTMSGNGIYGIRCQSSSLTITNCTISGNGSYGISCDNSSATITNCILWANNDDLSGCSATYSDIEDGDAGEGNISASPRFVDPAHGDFHLLASSPCIDKGSNAAVPEWLATDFEGDPRIYDGDGDGVAVVDMGADEYTIAITGVISGKVVLQGRSVHSGVEVSTGSYSATTDAGGSFTLSVPAGTYTVTAGMLGYASATSSNVVVTAGGTTTLPNVTLLAGDLNGDGVINIFDLVMLALNFRRDSSPW